MTVNDDNAAENNFQLLSKSKCSITSLCIEATASQCLKITTKKSHFYNIEAILLLFIEIDPTNGVKNRSCVNVVGTFLAVVSKHKLTDSHIPQTKREILWTQRLKF